MTSHSEEMPMGNEAVEPLDEPLIDPEDSDNEPGALSEGSEDVQEHGAEEKAVVEKPKKAQKKRKAVTESDTPLGWTLGTSIYREQFQNASKILAIDKLCIDFLAQHGQTRKLDSSHVNRIIDSFSVRPPLDMVDALVWDDGGMFMSPATITYLFLSPLR
jgi:hypothetical protein